MNLKKSVILAISSLAAVTFAQTAPAASTLVPAAPAATAPTTTAPSTITPAPAPATSAPQAAPAAEPVTEPVPAAQNATPSAAQSAAAQSAAAPNAAPAQATPAEAAPATESANEKPALASPVADFIAARRAQQAQDSTATPVEEIYEEPVAEPIAEPVATADNSTAAPAQATPAEAAPAENVAQANPNAVQPDSAAAANSVATPESTQGPVILPADSTAAAPATAFEPVNPADLPKKLHPMDILHGNAYNIVGNEAAAPTIGGDLYMPHKMLGHKLGYFEPIDGEGVVSFGETTTGFLAFDNRDDLGLLTAGFASGSFGLSVEAALAHHWNYTDNDGAITDSLPAESTTITSGAGNLYGITGSVKLGDLDLALKINYTNPGDETYKSADGVESDQSLWTAGGKLIASNTSDPGFAWTFALSVARHYSYKETTSNAVEYIDGIYYNTITETRATDTTSHIELVPELNIGSAVLEAEKARIFLGLNTSVPMLFYDRITDVCSRHNEYGLFMTPNILGEVYLGKYVMAFGSAAYQWDVLSVRDSYMNELSVKSIDIQSGTTTVNLGARFQYEMAAIEMVFTQEFLQNPFGSFSDHDAMAFSIGAFINF